MEDSRGRRLLTQREDPPEYSQHCPTPRRGGADRASSTTGRRSYSTHISTASMSINPQASSGRTGHGRARSESSVSTQLPAYGEHTRSPCADEPPPPFSSTEPVLEHPSPVVINILAYRAADDFELVDLDSTPRGRPANNFAGINRSTGLRHNYESDLEAARVEPGGFQSRRQRRSISIDHEDLSPRYKWWIAILVSFIAISVVVVPTVVIIVRAKNASR